MTRERWPNNGRSPPVPATVSVPAFDPFRRLFGCPRGPARRLVCADANSTPEGIFRSLCDHGHVRWSRPQHSAQVGLQDRSEAPAGASRIRSHSRPPNQSLLLSLLGEFRQRDTLGAHGLRPRARLLFCGPPGCGKAPCAEAFAHEVKLPLLVATMDALVSSLLGETASNLRKIFDCAAAQPVVLLLDESDAIARLRDDETLNGKLRRVVNSLLLLIEKFRGQGYAIAATNHERQLDPVIWRRFDEVIFFEKPTSSEVVRLLAPNFKNFNCDFDGREIAKFLEGFSHADIERVCLNSIRRAVLSEQKSVSKRRLLESISLETRRRDIAQGHTKQRR